MSITSMNLIPELRVSRRCRGSAASRAPAEIIITILDYLVQAHRDDPTRPSNDAEDSSMENSCTYARIQRDLYAASLVSRVWYNSGTGILYARPLIISSENLGRFSRTIPSKPELAGLVKSITCLQMSLPSPPSRLSTLCHPRKARAHSSITDHLSVVLQACPDNISLCLELKSSHSQSRGPSSRSPLPLLQSVPLSKLRRLTVCGRQTHIEAVFPPSPDLSRLEGLSLEQIHFERFDWPAVPLLQTLRLSRCVFRGTDSVLPLALPQLRSIDLSQVHALGKGNPIEELHAYAPTLESLTLIGSSYMSRPAPLQIHRFSQLKSFTMSADMVDPMHGMCLPKLHRLPSTVERLRIAGRSSNPTFSSVSEPETQLRDSLLRLVNDGRNGLAGSSLRRIHVEGDAQVWAGASKTLHHLCASKGIAYNTFFDSSDRATDIAILEDHKKWVSYEGSDAITYCDLRYHD